MEDKMMQNLENQTGKKFEEWLQIAIHSGKTKHGEIVAYLKTEKGLTHGYANLIAHKAKGSDAGSSTGTDLIEQQYRGKEHLKPLYDQLIGAVLNFGSDVDIAPKRAYVSLRRKKQFALIQPSTQTRLDVGINLKKTEATGTLEPAGSWNSMVSHRVKLTADDTPEKELVLWLRKAYEQAG